MEHSHHTHFHHHHGSDRHNHKIGRNLLLATLLNIVITVIEVAGSLISNSFALMSDALHNFSDTIAIFLAYISNKISQRKPNAKRTFGFKRVEILAALFNSIVLIVICIFIFIEAWKRFQDPQPINGLVMTVVATIGLIANFIAVSFLQQDKDKNLNVKAAYLHLIGDTLSSVAVVIGGIFIYWFNIIWLDPVLTFIIGLYILKETWIVLKQAYLILLQATPPEIELELVISALKRHAEIENVHHVHVWKLNDSQIHFECHVDLKTDYRISETEAILFRIKDTLKTEFGIEHTTIQFEYNCCNDKSIIY
jgi:cobalt-zinc-cadmium efflux system protein